MAAVGIDDADLWIADADFGNALTELVIGDADLGIALTADDFGILPFGLVA